MRLLLSASSACASARADWNRDVSASQLLAFYFCLAHYVPVHNATYYLTVHAVTSECHALRAQSLCVCPMIGTKHLLLEREFAASPSFSLSAVIAQVSVQAGKSLFSHSRQGAHPLRAYSGPDGTHATDILLQFT